MSCFPAPFIYKILSDRISLGVEERQGGQILNVLTILGIALGKHAFVLSKDAATNTVVLGDEADLFKKQVNISGLNLPSDPNALDGDVRCIAKLRYAHRGSECVLHRTSETTATLEFAEPQRAPTPGQFAVIYDADTGEHVLGAGVIE